MSDFKTWILRSSMMKKNVLIGGCLLLNHALAGGPDMSPPPPAFMFPTTPGVSLTGFGGNGWTGIGDVMAPVFGQPLNFTYINPQIYYHSPDSEYTPSLGVGQRWLTPSAGILGAYVFGDYNHSSNDHGFWFVSPGVERLGQVLDFSANLYIPVSNQQLDNGTEFADQAGDFSQIVFTGHDQYDELVNTFDTVGWGGDAQVGVRLPYRNSEVYVGGYYFAPKNADNIGGGSVRLQVPINNYFSALVSESYDSQYHNTVKGGLTLWFGGRRTGYSFTGDLRERLLEPVQRNLIAVAGGSHTGQPVVQSIQNTGQVALEMTNISFFVPGTTEAAVQGDGTYENPYVGMTQYNVDDANAQDNRNFYVNSGTYDALYENTVNPEYIVLNNDQLYGRQDNFRQNATGGNRPLINFTAGGFEIPDGDVNDSINGLQLAGSGTGSVGDAGIWVDDATSQLSQNVTINNTNAQFFGDGVDVLKGAAGTLTVAMDDSLLSNNSGGGELAASLVEGDFAALNSGSGLLVVNAVDSTFSNYAAVFDNVTQFNAVGGFAAENEADGSMIIDVTGSTFSGNSVSATDSLIGAAGGLAVSNGNLYGSTNTGVVTIDVNDSNFSGNTAVFNVDNGSSNLQAGALGGLAVTNNGTELNLNIDNSQAVNNIITGDVTNGSADSINTAGGVAITNAVQNENIAVNVDVNNSNFNDNILIFNNDTGSSENLYAVGGFSVFNFGDQFNLDVNNSNFNGNTITVDAASDGFYGGVVAGGLSINTAGTAFNLNVDNSNFIGNVVTADTETGGFTEFTATGGLAVYNSFYDLNVTVDNSSFTGNTVTMEDNGGSVSYIAAAGGLAVVNAGNNADIDVDNSNFTDNTITTIATNGVVGSSVISVAGGLAALNVTGSLNLNADDSYFNDNTIIALAESGSGTVISSAGGMAVENAGGETNLNTENSTFIGNDITATATGGSYDDIEVAAGLALEQSNTDGIIIGTNMNVNVDNAVITGNTITTNIAADSTGSLIDSAGGLGIFNSGIDMTVDVSNSNISGNSVDLTYTSTPFAAGGIAANNQGTGLTVDVNCSNITGNVVSAETATTSTAPYAIGGIALNNLSSTLGVNITNSTISANSQAGIDALGTGATVQLDGSSVSGNTSAALIANGGATISVTNPVYFYGVISEDTAGAITFPGLTPTSDQTVYCLFGQCSIVS